MITVVRDMDDNMQYYVCCVFDIKLLVFARKHQ